MNRGDGMVGVGFRMASSVILGVMGCITGMSVTVTMGELHVIIGVPMDIGDDVGDVLEVLVNGEDEIGRMG